MIDWDNGRSFCCGLKCGSFKEPLGCIRPGGSCDAYREFYDMRERLLEYEEVAPIEDVEFWSEAKKDGRMEIFPCKLEEVVYTHDDGKVHPSIIHKIELCINDRGEVERNVHHRFANNVSRVSRFGDFEETLFMSEEEAEHGFMF